MSMAKPLTVSQRRRWCFPRHFVTIQSRSPRRALPKDASAYSACWSMASTWARRSGLPRHSWSRIVARSDSGSSRAATKRFSRSFMDGDISDPTTRRPRRTTDRGLGVPVASPQIPDPARNGMQEALLRMERGAKQPRVRDAQGGTYPGRGSSLLALRTPAGVSIPRGRQDAESPEADGRTGGGAAARLRAHPRAALGLMATERRAWAHR